MSDLDLDRFCQVTDGDVPHAARNHIADQRASSLLALKARDSQDQSVWVFIRTWSCGDAWTHLEQVGAAEEHEVDPGHRGELSFCQGEGRQQRGWQGDLGQRVHLVRLKMDLQGRVEGFRWTQTQVTFSAQSGNLLVPEAQRCWAPKRR